LDILPEFDTKQINVTRNTHNITNIATANTHDNTHNNTTAKTNHRTVFFSSQIMPSSHKPQLAHNTTHQIPVTICAAPCFHPLPCRLCLPHAFWWGS